MRRPTSLLSQIKLAIFKNRNLKNIEKFLWRISPKHKKVPKDLEHEINLEVTKIAENLEFDDPINCLAKTSFYYHEEDFRTNPTCRLINPAKSELGKISKNILEEIKTELRSILELNQWKSTRSVTEWFNNIENKKNCAFIQLDIKDFYPSTTEKILNNAIEFAKEYTTIIDDDIRIIKHCRRFLLFEKDATWVKKGTAGNFDVTMGSYDGAKFVS